jgi:hypothetical protein
VTETNFKNITFKLYYSNNTLINSTTYNITGIYNINWTGLSGDDYKYNISIYDTAGNSNSSATRSITLITSQDSITLNSGWNLISLPMKNTDTGTDRNISLVKGWNLIGYNGAVNTSLTNANFTNSSGTQLTWQNAIANNKVQAYLAYYDSSPATASERQFKYLSSLDGFDDATFRQNRGYWLYANEAGTLTIPGIGGTKSGETYAISKLRFSNGSLELNYTTAGNLPYNWISDVKYWGWNEDCLIGIGCNDWISLTSGNINSSLGYFFKVGQDNLTLIRQN